MEQEIRNQRLSHFRNLIAIAFSDGSVDESEKDVMLAIGKRIGITSYEIQEILENPDNIELCIPKSMIEKLNHIYDLVLIMLADGKIDKNEIAGCKLIAMQYGLDHNIVDIILNKLIKKIKDGTQINIITEVLKEIDYPIEDTKHKAIFEKLMFISNDHIRYQNGIDVSGHNYNCKRGIKIEPNINEDFGYTVTIHNLDGIHPIWGNNIQMAPKQMKIVEQTEKKIILKGYGKDNLGESYSDYGISIFLDNEKIEKIILHMYDRKIDIEYLK